MKNIDRIEISEGVVHTLPDYLRDALITDATALAKWEALTPLARNEWICWVTYPKQEATRMNHVKRIITELKEGKRRPCCWIGCIHRTDKAISPSIQGILNKQKRQSIRSK